MSERLCPGPLAEAAQPATSEPRGLATWASRANRGPLVAPLFLAGVFSQSGGGADGSSGSGSSGGRAGVAAAGAEGWPIRRAPSTARYRPAYKGRPERQVDTLSAGGVPGDAVSHLWREGAAGRHRRIHHSQASHRRHRTPHAARRTPPPSGPAPDRPAARCAPGH